MSSTDLARNIVIQTEGREPLIPANAFCVLIRDNREVCSHCFSRIRSVETFEDAAESEWRLRKKQWLADLSVSKSVDDGRIAYDGYRTSLRWDPERREYTKQDGTPEPRVACNTCGWLGSRTQNRDLSLSEMENRVPRLIKSLVWQGAHYNCPENPGGYRVTVDIDSLYDRIRVLKTSPEHKSGEDTEIFASAVERSCSVSPRTPTSKDNNGQR